MKDPLWLSNMPTSNPQGPAGSTRPSRILTEPCVTPGVASASVERTMKELTCAGWLATLRDYTDGALDAEGQAAFEAHATSCALCQQFLKDYLAVPDLVRLATDVAIPPEVRMRLAKLFRVDDK
jgi:hypothetical protein